MIFLFFLSEILILSFLSRLVSQKLYIFFYLLFRSKSIALSLTMALFFPGTVIHELSHLFTAEVLGVRTGKLTLVPESLQGEDVRAGSVEIAQTDPFRRTIIGIAPLIIGVITLSLFTDFFVQALSHIPSFFVFPPTQEGILFLGALLLLFAISNTMIPSPTDLKGAWVVGILVVLASAALWYTGILHIIPLTWVDYLVQVTTHLVISLETIMVVNVVFLVSIGFLSFLLLKITNKKLTV